MPQFWNQASCQVKRMTDNPLHTSPKNPDKPPTVVCTTQDSPSVLTGRTGSSSVHSGMKTAVILLLHLVPSTKMSINFIVT